MLTDINECNQNDATSRNRHGGLGCWNNQALRNHDLGCDDADAAGPPRAWFAPNHDFDVLV